MTASTQASRLGRCRVLALALLAGAATSLCAAATAGAVTITEFSAGMSDLGSPSWIAADALGNAWYIDDAAPRIGRVTSSGVITEYPITTPDVVPIGIGVGPDGNIWFAEGGGDSLLATITPTGTITEVDPGAILPTGGIATGPDHNLWLTGLLPVGGKKVAAIGRMPIGGTLATFTSGFGPESYPQSITLGPDGNMWFTDFEDQIGRVTPAGVITEFPVPAGSRPDDITRGPDGNVWFTSQETGKIGRITPSGVVTEFSLPNARSHPRGIVAGPDGNLWFTESTEGVIGRITPAGTVTEFHEPGPGLPIGIASGPNAKLWFGDAQGRIGRITIYDPPVVTTEATSAITATTATLNALIDDRGSATSAHFDYGTTDSYGTSTPVQTFAADSKPHIAASITGLAPETRYYFRLVATNLGGTINGGTIASTGHFTTGQVPRPPDTPPPPPPSTIRPPAAPITTPPPPPPPPASTAPVRVQSPLVKECPVAGQTILGSDANDALSGTAATDLVFGLAGGDVLRGMAGGDCLFGELGNDRLFGGAGADTLLGGTGADTLRGDSGDDALYGEAGNDTISGGKGDDGLDGGAGSDALTDDRGTDEFNGGAGDDRIDARDATAAGRRAADTVSCGAGRHDVALVDRRDHVARDCERVRTR
ncbi:MAG: virginiamycin lyase [Solirubrobacteraceae bacterium]|nr:virginiamycin lyase [Solirubrobacteraceae bacterium]